MLKKIQEKIEAEKKNFISFDVMVNDRYLCTMKMRHCKLFPIKLEELEKFVIEQRPSLAGKKFEVFLNENEHI